MTVPKLFQRNIEIKARCGDVAKVRRLAIERGAKVAGDLMQTDTYFFAPRGRLKLRETKDGAAELISYTRPDLAGVKASEYVLVRIQDPASLKAVLAGALGIRAIVSKRRELLLWKNVRIHLDEVETLGKFLELEAVVGADADEDISSRRTRELMGVLQVEPENLLAGSYLEMIESRERTPIS